MAFYKEKESLLLSLYLKLVIEIFTLLKSYKNLV
jgi:hypothetical protein